jgi:hypothetical protein
MLLGPYHVRHNVQNACKGRGRNRTSSTRSNLLPRNFGYGRNSIIVQDRATVVMIQILVFSAHSWSEVIRGHSGTWEPEHEKKSELTLQHS